MEAEKKRERVHREQMEEVVMDLNRALVRAIRKKQADLERGTTSGTTNETNDDQQNETVPNTSRAMNVVEIPAICSFKYCEDCKMV